MKYYLMAAEQGHAEAQNSVGSGLQAEKRYSEARIWYERSSAQENAVATNNLAYLYDLGLGVPQDRKKGFELYTKSAELGWPEAMWNLANIYGAGQIDKPDIMQACIWVSRAGRFAGDNHSNLSVLASRAMLRLQKVLTEDQFTKCNLESSLWTPGLTPIN